MKQGLDMYLASPLYWLLVVGVGLATFGLVLLRRRYRKNKWYDITLILWVALNVFVCVAPFGFVIGWSNIGALVLPFVIAGAIQGKEVLDHADKKRVIEEARSDDEGEEMAGRS